MQQTLSPALQQRRREIISKFGERQKFLDEFNPDLQMKICKDTDLCFFGDSPALSEINMAYGEKTSMMWLIPQLFNLSEYCGCKEKLNNPKLRQLAYVISTEFYYLKVTEIMLFFHRFKSGKYGRFYGTVDPLLITCSLRSFLNERNYEIDRHDNEERMRKLDEWRNALKKS